MNKYQRKLISIKEYFDTKSFFAQKKVMIPVVLFMGIFFYMSFDFPLAATHPVLYWACVVLVVIPFLSFASFYVLLGYYNPSSTSRKYHIWFFVSQIYATLLSLAMILLLTFAFPVFDAHYLGAQVRTHFVLIGVIGIFNGGTLTLLRAMYEKEGFTYFR